MMKRVILLLIVLFVPLAKGRAQENLYYVEHPHSVTVSTGIPYVFAMLYPPGHMDNRMTKGGLATGIGYKTWTGTNLNVGYNYQLNRRWEIAMIFTMCGYVYSSYRYPKTGTDEEGNAIYDWKADPLESSLHYEHRAFIPAVIARYYWLARKSSFQMYSAAGLGCTIAHSNVPFFPTLTLVGTRFGGKHWYGQAELTAGTTATLFLAGVGYRF